MCAHMCRHTHTHTHTHTQGCGGCVHVSCGSNLQAAGGARPRAAGETRVLIFQGRILCTDGHGCGHAQRFLFAPWHTLLPRTVTHTHTHTHTLPRHRWPAPPPVWCGSGRALPRSSRARWTRSASTSAGWRVGRAGRQGGAAHVLWMISRGSIFHQPYWPSKIKGLLNPSPKYTSIA